MPAWAESGARLPCRSDDGARTCRLPLTHRPPAFYSCFSWTCLHLLLKPPGLNSRKQQLKKSWFCAPPPPLKTLNWSLSVDAEGRSRWRTVTARSVRSCCSRSTQFSLKKLRLFIQSGAGSWGGKKTSISPMTRAVLVSAYDPCVFTQSRPPGLQRNAPPISLLLRFPRSCHGRGKKGVIQHVSSSANTSTETRIYAK